jgi:hypothetical protein
MTFSMAPDSTRAINSSMKVNGNWGNGPLIVAPFQSHQKAESSWPQAAAVALSVAAAAIPGHLPNFQLDFSF